MTIVDQLIAEIEVERRAANAAWEEAEALLRDPDYTRAIVAETRAESIERGIERLKARLASERDFAVCNVAE